MGWVRSTLLQPGHVRVISEALLSIHLSSLIVALMIPIILARVDSGARPAEADRSWSLVQALEYE